MEQLDVFLFSVDPLFDWESFITPDLEEAFKEALKEDNTSGGQEPEITEKRKAVYGKENHSNNGDKSHHSKKKAKGKSSKRFAPSLSNNEIQQMSIPFSFSNTKMSTQWAVRNFLDWVDSHNASSSDICPEVVWRSRPLIRHFILLGRKGSGA